MELDAWIELSEKEHDSVWAVMYSRFAFFPRIEPRNFPGFKEPAPSITFSCSEVYGEEDRFLALNKNLHENMLTIFQQIIQPGDYLYALNWHHPCYKFFPHKDFDTREILEWSAEWPVPILPNGDYYIFLEKNFEFGILGHPWEQSMCIFGDKLLDAMAPNMPKLFQNPIRKKT